MNSPRRPSPGGRGSRRPLPVIVAGALGAVLICLPAHALLNQLGAKIDPPALAAGGSGTLRILLASDPAASPGDQVVVCVPSGVTLGTPRNDPHNLHPLGLQVQGACLTATPVANPLATEADVVELPFSLAASFVSTAAAPATVSLTFSEGTYTTAAASLPMVLAGTGPVLRVESEVHSFLDFRYRNLCLVNDSCWFEVTVTNDGDAPAASWLLSEALPFSCTAVTSSLRGALPIAAPAPTTSAMTLDLPGMALAPHAAETFRIDCTAPNTPYEQDSSTARALLNGVTATATVNFEVLGVAPPIARRRSAPADGTAAAVLITQTAVVGAPDDRLPLVALGDVFALITTAVNVGNAATVQPVLLQGLLDPTATAGSLTLLSSTSYVLRADGSASPRVACAGTPSAAEACVTPAPLAPGDTAVAVRWVRVSSQPPGDLLDLVDQSYTVASPPLFVSWGNEVSIGVFPAIAGDCVADGRHLCLQGNRFDVGVTWTTYTSLPLAGRGNPSGLGLLGDSGYFWFFTPSNVELVTKVLDGTAVNDSFWLFYGALSNVEYVLTARDTVTGTVKSYFSANGVMASVADTSAFGAGASTAAIAAAKPAAPVPAPQVWSILPAAAAAPCQPDASSLCLLGNRFRVEATWQTTDGRRGTASAVSLTSDTGWFWFFSPGNVELVVKVIDGTLVNGKDWVFYGALSDVAYTITVTDTQTGTVRSYTNPEGRLASVGDTGAF
jgi:hypothetical protein